MEYSYYIEDPRNREARLTRLFSASFFEKVLGLVGFNLPAVLITEWDKSHYGCRGDVDIAAFQLDEAGNILGCAAVEIKVSLYVGNREYKSLKPFKHLEQVDRQKGEGWDQVFLRPARLQSGTGRRNPGYRGYGSTRSSSLSHKFNVRNSRNRSEIGSRLGPLLF